LNRLELSRDAPTRYARIAADTAAIEALFVDLFLDAHAKTPAQITLDLDATDDPLHGQQGEQERGRRPRKPAQPVLPWLLRLLLRAPRRRVSPTEGGSVQTDVGLV
jgi:Transposase DDE domain group 1